MLNYLLVAFPLYVLIGMLLDKLVVWSRKRKDQEVTILGSAVLWFLWPQVIYVMVRARRAAAKKKAKV